MKPVAPLLIGLLIGQAALADNAEYCPGTIGALEGTPFTKKVSDVLRPLYQELGCELIMELLPGNRSTVLFNQKRISGELFRAQPGLAKLSGSYLVTSPVSAIYSVKWQHPDKSLANLGTGYTLGIYWMELYASQHTNMHMYYTVDEAADAFSKGRIGYMLSGDDYFAAGNPWFINDLPQVVEQIDTLSVMHILQPEYADFANDLNTLLSTAQ